MSADARAALLGLLADYGSDVTEAAGLRAYQRATRPGRDRKIRSAAQYVGICRAIAPETGRPTRASWERHWPAGAVDGRLIACGWNHVAPRAWVGGEMARFLAYWARAAGRPDTVGSSYNPDPDAAARAFFAGIPAALVRSGLRLSDREGCVRPMPRERVRRLLNATRAAKRTSVGHRTVSTKALARLGQLCPELQRAALASLPNEPGQYVVTAVRDDGTTEGFHRPLRVRDLDWGAVARLQQSLATCATGRVRAAWATGKRQIGLLLIARPEGTGAYDWTRDDPAGVDLDAPTASRWLAPGYPRLPLPMAARIARGEAPVSIAASVDPDARLTRAEAHAWCSAGAPQNVLAWWCERGNLPAVRSWAVARWLRAVADRGDWHSLTRERTIRGPAGAEAIVAYLDRVDEIQDCDLVRGPRTGVDPAFERAAERCGEAWMAKARQDHRVLAGLPVGWRLFPRCMRHLATPAQLAREGDEMGHCVGGYAPAVESGRSVIIAIRVGEARSTVELDRSGRVLQHRGASNAEPHAVTRRALMVAARRNGWEVSS